MAWIAKQYRLRITDLVRIGKLIRVMWSRPLVRGLAFAVLIIEGLWLFGRLFILVYAPATKPITDLTIVALVTDSEGDYDHSRKEYLFDGEPAPGHLGGSWSSDLRPPPHFVFMKFDKEYNLSSMQIYNSEQTQLDAVLVRVDGTAGAPVVFDDRGLSGVDPIEVALGDSPIRSIRIEILASTKEGRRYNSTAIREIVFPGFRVKLSYLGK